MKDLRMTVFLLLLFSICTLLLTGGKIAYDKASAIFNQRLYAEIMDLYGYPRSEETIESDFDERFTTVERGGQVYYIGKEPGRQTVAFTISGPGLWSQIDILLGVEPEESKLFGLRVISQGETPGLGGRIAEASFQRNFSGLSIRPKVKIVKFAMGSNEIDAISGATKTSKALETLINRGIENLDREFTYLFPGKGDQDG